MTSLQQRLAALQNSPAAETLTGMQRGIEKESLRISTDGRIAVTPHPEALGSALTHPHITTDYSEALLEFITPPSTDLHQPLKFLEALHCYTYKHIGDEVLWVNSMPCVVTDDDSIPVAQYGSSNVGRMKTIYRYGLGHRYGRKMQTIAGIHYNFSYSDAFWALHQAQEGSDEDRQTFISRRYFDLTRNFQRHAWLLVYLFGASPALCPSFLSGRRHQLDPHPDSHTLYKANATSLRMSDLGYQNNAQSALAISYNSLDQYVAGLNSAISTPDADYQRIGVRDDQGRYKQLNANILQIENEYYSSIRPKQITRSGERPTQALSRRGVQYIEIRALDLNPFSPVGITDEQIRFLDVFATYCLLADSPLMDERALQQSKDNLRGVVYQGRDTGTELVRDESAISIAQWGNELLAAMAPIADLFDRSSPGTPFRDALRAQHDKIADPSLTPSAQVLNAMAERQQSFFQFALSQALAHRDHFLQRQCIDTDRLLAHAARQSVADQKAIEAQDDVDFDTYLANYFNDD